MNYFFNRAYEAKKIRQQLSANDLPIEEEVFCSALSNGRVKGFERLNDTEFEDLKRIVNGFTHTQLLDGIYSIACELKVVPDITRSFVNDEKIIEYLKTKEVINQAGWFKLKNQKGDLIHIVAPFQKQSYYLATLVSYLVGQMYLANCATLN